MAKALDSSSIESALNDLDGWSYRDSALHRSFSFKDFRGAMAFLVHVGFIAEQFNHHPEIRNVYSSVELSLQTHDAGNQVTRKDLDFAAAVNALDC